MAYLVSWSELIGGLLVVIGSWSVWAAAGLGIIMLGAVFFTFQGGLLAFGFPLALFGGLLFLLAAGPGALAIRLKNLDRPAEEPERLKDG